MRLCNTLFKVKHLISIDLEKSILLKVQTKSWFSTGAEMEMMKTFFPCQRPQTPAQTVQANIGLHTLTLYHTIPTFNDPLTHYQMTKFRLVQIETVCRQQF